jgi:hypothetical protein
MAIAIIQTDFPEGFGADLYDAVNAEMGIDGDFPPGLIFHWVGEVDGKFTITDIWESRQDYDAFNAARLTPAIEKVAAAAGAPADAEQRTIEAQVHNHFNP